MKTDTVSILYIYMSCHVLPFLAISCHFSPLFCRLLTVPAFIKRQFRKCRTSLIRALWEAETDKLQEYLNGLNDDDGNGILTFERRGEKRQSVLWHCLAHVVNHGTQHRSECAALLTGFGHSPGNMDFTVFLVER